MGTAALTGGTITDVMASQNLPGQVVVITAARSPPPGRPGRSPSRPGADTRDVSGRWITPGPADTHCHLTPLADGVPLELFLACGVTTVRDPGGHPAEQPLLRDAVRDGTRTGPCILASGEILDGDPPPGKRHRTDPGDTPARGSATVRHLAARSMDCIKIYNSLTEDVLAAIITAGTFTIALNAARDLLTQAAGVTAGTVIDLIGDIGRRVLAACYPAGACASARASSSAPSPNTRPEALISSGAATKQPSASTYSPHPGLDTNRPTFNYVALQLALVSTDADGSHRRGHAMAIT